MSALEFDLLDELYFVTPFEKLQQAVGLSPAELKEALAALLEKGWVKCFAGEGGEVLTSDLRFEQDYLRYHYLATKDGLLAHNSR